MKNKIILCLALVLSGGLTVSAFMAHIPVTTNSLDQGTYIFSVSTNFAQGGTAFHITITARKGDFSPDSHIGLGIMRGENFVSIQPESLTPKIILKKDDHAWQVDFIESNELLKNPDICFTFEVIPYVISSDGKRVPITGGEIYEVKLRDFLKQ